jgi:hypothetical protein
LHTYSAKLAFQPVSNEINKRVHQQISVNCNHSITTDKMKTNQYNKRPSVNDKQETCCLPNKQNKAPNFNVTTINGGGLPDEKPTAPICGTSTKINAFQHLFLS